MNQQINGYEGLEEIVYSKIIIVFLLLIIAVMSFVKVNAQPDTEYLIRAMETARDSHQYFVENPDKVVYSPTEFQDERWVEIYDGVIKELKR